MDTQKEITAPREGLYICHRTSQSSSNEKPCEEAFLINTIRVDTRYCDDPKKIPANKGTDGDWYERGTNHRVEEGKIKRDLGILQCWAVEDINLKDFLKDFLKKYGECVLWVDEDGYFNLEIYDDYLE